MKIENITMYGDNWFQEVDFPTDIKLYKMPDALSDKQNNYVAITYYSEELYEMCCDIHAANTEIVNDKLIISFVNEPMGCNITDFDNISDDYKELGHLYEPIFKNLSVKSISKNKYINASDDINEFFKLSTNNASDDELIAKLNTIIEKSGPPEIITSISKVLSYDGYNVKFAKLYTKDIDNKDVFSCDVLIDPIWKFFEYTKHPEDIMDYWIEIGSLDEFNNHFEDFLLEIHHK